MESVRLPRFKRVAEIAPIQLTGRDREIIRQVHRHRFLRSSHIVALIGGSSQQVLRRLQRLFHHGYLERPRSQIDYFHKGGSQRIVYGVGVHGARLLQQEENLSGRRDAGSSDNRTIGRLFLEHALLTSDVMVALELAYRRNGRARLLHHEELPLPEATRRQREPFHWSVTLGIRIKLGLIPDRVFAVEFLDQPAGRNRAFYFLEADRGTMPVSRQTLAKSSFARKLLAYEATWQQNVHRNRFGFHRFRVLTVTTSAERARNLAAAAARLGRGHGLFLFTDLASFQSAPDLLAFPWKTARIGQTASFVAQ